MGAVAIPLIETAVVRLLTALGVGVAAGAAADAAREAARARTREAEKATASPLARAEVCERAGSSRDTCKLCPPINGHPFMQPTAGWSERSIEYQQRIGQMPPAAPGHLTEWMFNGVSFDGFDSQQCLLKEAKAGYDQFFDEWGVPKEFFRGMDVMQEQFRRQAVAAVPRPPTRLRWHFMEPKSYRYFALEAAETFPDVEVAFLP